MPHKIQWLVQDRVIYSEFEGVISGEELQAFIGEVRGLVAEGTPMVDHISNSLQLERVTFSLATAQSLASAVDMIKEIGWQVDINQNTINKMFAGITSQFARVRFRTFATYDEAIIFLQHNDDTLAGLDWKTPESVAIS